MSSVLITITGADHPGITAGFSRILDAHGLRLTDLTQAVVHGQLTLCLVAEGEPEAAFEADLKACAGALDVTVSVGHAPEPGDPTRYAITAIADSIGAHHVASLATLLAEHGANIQAIDRLSEGGLSALEIVAALPDADRLPPLRHALLALALRESIDLAIQREDLLRRAKRLVVFDMDSTLISVEVIDELARAWGVYEQVRALTASAMGGALDYAESLRRRVALLEGLPYADVQRIAEGLPLTDGVEQLVGTLKTMGVKTAVISGGFDVAARRVQARLGLDHAHSNTLEVVDGRLTGRVLEPVVTPERKVALLETIAMVEGVPLEQTVAIGDGANDLLMIERAGLGIAFHPKATLRQAADTSLSSGGLDRVQYLLGFGVHATRALQAK